MLSFASAHREDRSNPKNTRTLAAKATESDSPHSQPWPAKSKFDPRKMMEKAIDVMELSVKEPRSDKKASPLVGAVLVKPDGTLDTASRGELRHGDHAEYTLLDSKHRNERLDGSVLFATLEPCAPGARKHPKLTCAERIVNARIAEVWVGIEDPDPAVDRQGIRYLEQNGIKVHLFDLDLQDRIRQANKEFIAQALQRAAEAKDGKTAKHVPLSPWDEDSGWRGARRLGIICLGSLSRAHEDSGQGDVGQVYAAA